MKVDTEWVKKQYLLCKQLVQILGTTSNKLNKQYIAAGENWNDKYYHTLGEIVQECNSSLLTTVLKISDVLDGLEQTINAIEEYNSVNLSGTGSVSNSSDIEAVGNASAGTSNSTVDEQSAIMAAGAQWASQLSSTQHSAVYAYTDNAYYNINASLRGKANFSPGNAERAIAIHQALSGAQIPCDCVVYRGASREALGQYQQLSDDQLIGCVIRDGGFMSTSLQRDNAFMGDIQIEISVPAGTHGAYLGTISRFPNEQEVLFDAHQQLEITGVRRGTHGERIISARMLI